jgi:D-serine deaminase-like pyridoxal phosphate-dependent protein
VPDQFAHISPHLRRSSLGDPTVRRLAARTSPATAAEALRRAALVTHPGHRPENGVPPMATNRRTSPKAASAASKVLRDGRTSKASKTAAGSALSQRAPKGKGKR